MSPSCHASLTLPLTARMAAENVRVVICEDALDNLLGLGLGSQQEVRGWVLGHQLGDSTHVACALVPSVEGERDVLGDVLRALSLVPPGIDCIGAFYALRKDGGRKEGSAGTEDPLTALGQAREALSIDMLSSDAARLPASTGEEASQCRRFQQALASMGCRDARRPLLLHLEGHVAPSDGRPAEVSARAYLANVLSGTLSEIANRVECLPAPRISDLLRQSGLVLCRARDSWEVSLRHRDSRSVCAAVGRCGVCCTARARPRGWVEWLGSLLWPLPSPSMAFEDPDGAADAGLADGLRLRHWGVTVAEWGEGVVLGSVLDTAGEQGSTVGSASAGVGPWPVEIEAAWGGEPGTSSADGEGSKSGATRVVCEGDLMFFLPRDAGPAEGRSALCAAQRRRGVTVCRALRPATWEVGTLMQVQTLAFQPVSLPSPVSAAFVLRDDEEVPDPNSGAQTEGTIESQASAGRPRDAAPVTLPRVVTRALLGDLDESQLAEQRRNVHAVLGLPTSRPLFLAGQSWDVARVRAWARGEGPAGARAEARECFAIAGCWDSAGAADGRWGDLWEELDAWREAGSIKHLRSLHARAPGLRSPLPDTSVRACVRGDWELWHYGQGGSQDRGWGCAYRSLQTIASWFVAQGLVCRPVPIIREIQEALVEVGDKEQLFVGSQSWIGAVELGFALDHLLGVTGRIVHVRSGLDIPAHAAELAEHFRVHGSPVMVGGGVLAYTILGVEHDPASGDCALLVADPHYTGPDVEDKVLAGRWVAWKRPTDKSASGGDLFKPSAFYNLLLPQVPKGP